MGILDKAIAAISPKWGAQRAKSRYVMNAYEAAMPSRTHKAKRESQGANISTKQSAVSLREQARALDQNHDIVIGILDKMEERVIGSRGIHIEPQPLNLSGDVDEELAEQIRKKWAEWSVRPEVTGQFTRPELERMLLRTWLRDGEVFIQLVRGSVAGLNHSTDIAFSLEALEPDFMLLPTSLYTRAKQVLGSASVEGADINSGIINPIRDIVPTVKSARLQVADPKSWYLINKEAIEVSYLDGIDTPYMEQQQGFTVDGVSTKVRIDAGVNVIDYRGIVKVTNK